MVRDYSKLALRARNAEADNLVRDLKPYKVDSAIDRLTKIAATISKLGKTMNIRISDEYHRLRIRELELTADYLEKRAEDKERERLSENVFARSARFKKNLLGRERGLRRSTSTTSTCSAATKSRELKMQLTELAHPLGTIKKAIEDVDYRVANVRAGYVYVISNLGAFGDRMIKIGLTRRLDPTERVRELGDASVPFKYDTHALVFSSDAVGLESEMHSRLADQRVNRVNKRREFFYATPAQVKDLLVELAGDLLEYNETAEAVEYRQSLNEGGQGA